MTNADNVHQVGEDVVRGCWQTETSEVSSNKGTVGAESVQGLITVYNRSEGAITGSHVTTPKLKSVRLNSCELEVDGEKDIVSSPRNTFMVLLPEPSLR